MIALGAGWLAIAVMALGDRAAALRLVWPVVLGAALVGFGQMLVLRGAVLGEVVLAVGVAAAVAVVPLALGHGARRREAALLGAIVLPAAAWGVAMAGGMMLPVGMVAIVLAGIGAWVGGAGWMAMTALGMAGLGGGLGEPVAGTLAATALGCGEALRRLWPALPRQIGMVAAIPALLPVLAAEPGWVIATVVAGLGLTATARRP